jgi:4-aminobutyrate aminotransferase-like enzyme
MKREATLDLLRRYESRNVTHIDGAAGWPIVWEKAKGCHVWDENGKKYLDLTAAFGVAAAGHANARVVAAAKKQMGRLLHAMGDVHPHRLKAELARELSRITFERWKVGRAKCIFGNSGFEAVEAALKTAWLATKKPSVIAFEGGYHGLGYGALNATHREHFRNPFRAQLKEFGIFVQFPSEEAELDEVGARIRKLVRQGEVGAILVEPIQVRGGIRIPPRGFLALLRKIRDEHGIVLIFDEIYTGFGRTGKWFGCEHEEVVPDLICLGKALTGGFPLSACVGRVGLMDSWPESSGEAIHTSTFLGHPVGCAMALAQIREIETQKLVSRSRELGKYLMRLLNEMKPKRDAKARGHGLLCGLEITSDGRPATASVLKVIARLLHRGFVFLPEGEHANVISFTPPLTIAKWQLKAAVKALEDELEKEP